MGFFNWPPFKLYAIDADTGKPLDANVGKKTQVTYYDIKRTKKGSNVMVAHRADSKGSTTQDEKKSKHESPITNNNANQQAGGDGEKGEVEWTSEEDEKLKQMKADNKSWKDIATEMGKVQHVLKARWKIINPTIVDAGKNNKPAAKQDINKKEFKPNQKKEAHQEKKPKQDKHVKHVKQDKKRKHKDQSSSPKEEPKFTLDEWQTLQEDDQFSFGELRCISELIMKDSGQSWLRVAARFFDLTGRRVHPDDIRDKFEQMATVG